jgi:hypothetical protein
MQKNYNGVRSTAASRRQSRGAAGLTTTPPQRHLRADKLTAMPRDGVAVSSDALHPLTHKRHYEQLQSCDNTHEAAARPQRQCPAKNRHERRPHCSCPPPPPKQAPQKIIKRAHKRAIVESIEAGRAAGSGRHTPAPSHKRPARWPPLQRRPSATNGALAACSHTSTHKATENRVQCGRWRPRGTPWRRNSTAHHPVVCGRSAPTRLTSRRPCLCLAACRGGMAMQSRPAASLCTL